MTALAPAPTSTDKRPRRAARRTIGRSPSRPPTPPRHRAPDHAAVRDRLRGLDRMLAPAVFVAAAVIGTWNVTGAVPFQDDEGTYVAQAVAVQNGYLAPYTYWYDHPPFGWIQLAFLGRIPQLLGLGGGSDVAALRYVAAILFAVAAMLVFLVARRIGVGRVFALVAAAVFVLSPLPLTLGRQVFLDTIALVWVLFAFYLALSPRVAMWHHVGAGVTVGVAVVSKITVAAFGPALLVAMLDRAKWHGRAFSVVGFLSAAGLVMALFPLMAVLRGELFSGADHVSLQDGLAYQFLSRGGSGWIWEADSARNDLLHSWKVGDRFLVVGGLVGAVLCAWRRETRWIPVAILCFALPVVVGRGYLPAMYAIAGLPFLALAIGAAGHLVWRVLTHLVAGRMPWPDVGTRALAATVIGGALLVPPIEQWTVRGLPMLQADENADWRSTLQWVADNVPRDETIVAPYSMWQDINKQGWNDPWAAIVLEKVDLDIEFDQEHPNGIDAIDWIVEGPTVASNVEYLGLERMNAALTSSRVVVSFGDWNIREVVHPVAEPR